MPSEINLSIHENERLVLFVYVHIYSNISGYSNTDEFCLVFLDSVKNFSAKSQINSVHVKYLNFGVQYNFKVDHSPCESYLTLQHVEMMLLCQEKTGSRTNFVIEIVSETVVFAYINFKILFFYTIDFNQSYEITNDKDFLIRKKVPC